MVITPYPMSACIDIIGDMDALENIQLKTSVLVEIMGPVLMSNDADYRHRFALDDATTQLTLYEPQAAAWYQKMQWRRI